MNAHSSRLVATTGAQSMWTAAARIAWHVVRLPLLESLTLLEPVVRVIFSLAMVLGIFAAIVFELSATGAQFEFLTIFAWSLGCGLTMLVYYGLLALVSR